MRASELRVGDVLVTAIGRAPIKSIEPKAGGLEVVLDIRAEGSSRSERQGSILFLWPRQDVRLSRNAIPARIRAPGSRLFGGTR